MMRHKYGPEVEAIRRRADLAHLRAILLIATLAWGGYALWNGLRGHLEMAEADLLSSLGVMLMLALAVHGQDERSHRVAGHGAVLVSLCGLVTASRLGGDEFSRSIWWLTLIPAGAAYLAGWRSAIIWGSAAMMTAWALSYAGQVYPPLPPDVPTRSDLIANQTFLIAAVMGFSVASRRVTERQVRALQEHEHTIAHQAHMAQWRAYDLEQAHAEVVRASEARRQFLANMSHEIRTPLNGIIGMTLLLKNSRLASAEAELVSTIESSSQLLLSVVNDVLDFSRLESGRLSVERTEFDLQTCLDDVLELFSQQIVSRSVDLAGWLAPGVSPQASGDPMRVRQILSNLVGNAVKFTHEGSIVVTIERNGDVIGMRVKDTGIGISPQRRDALFQPFTQADASTTRKYGGSGLGLTISRQLAVLMGGTIEVESELGQGSVFHATVVAPAVGRSAPPPRLAGLHIGAIEVSQATATAIETMGRSAGASVFLLETLEQLTALLEAEPLDVLLIGGSAESLGDVRKGWPSLPLVRVARLGTNDATDDAAAWTSILRTPLRQAHFVNTIQRVAGGLTSPDVAPPTRQLDEDMGSRLPLRILIVEDNLANQEVLTSLLERLGYRADLAENGRQAVKAAENKSYDLILMDMHMPEMDGAEATRRIRAHASGLRRAPYIVGLSASVLPHEQAAFRKAGAEEVLTKPIELKPFLAVLDSCGRARSTTSTAAPTAATAALPTGVPAPIPGLDEVASLDARPLAGLRAICNRKPERFVHMVATYVRDSARNLQRIRDGLQDRDPSMLGLAAHSLKSSSATFGCMRVSRLAAHLEALVDGAAASEWAHLAAVDVQLEREHRTAVMGLRHVVPELGFRISCQPSPGRPRQCAPEPLALARHGLSVALTLPCCVLCHLHATTPIAETA